MSGLLPPLRRLAVLVVSLLCLLGAEAALPVTGATPVTAIAAADAVATYDAGVPASDCALVGRVFVRGEGCARERCVEGAVVWRRTAGAEACALPGQPRGYGYAATVDVRTCRALHRRWLASVNYCAAQPDRSVRTLPDAPQCRGAHSTYVVGRVDACVRPGDAPPPPTAVREHRTGVLVVGDSLGWRGGDELVAMHPAVTVDAQPGRRPSELLRRLDAYRTHSGPVTGLVVELGTNTAPGYGRADLAAAMRTLPGSTRVLLVEPFVAAGTGSSLNSPAAERFGAWMRSVAQSRSHTCVADWPAYVRAHAGLLQDGIHPRHDAEAAWATWVADAWSACR
ncbi:hypothetical protein G5V58_05320 [Nocardioides anomalus]|uniref:SGNH/GDSL hydrolase family protein n=1 Tax=Nocardioides anomalus TaxID=2712223 RepID=A0A6G6WB46_9ACTN|nr:hypothetical protein [Nocardioides anomalus]QIG42260.1 hypothetical protein G5V58_05320 [Nocardioides anomalus]